MAIPVYTTDLSTVNLVTGIWTELTGATAGRSVSIGDIENFIQGVDCVSQATSAIGAMGFACPSTAISVASGDGVFMWLYHGNIPAVSIFANGGYEACIGQDISNYNRWTMFGRDTLPKGGWFSAVVDPTIPPTSVQGVPSTVTNVFGSRFLADVKISKGTPHANDVIRHGRSIILTDGDIVTPANFFDCATENDLNLNKWGLFEFLGGSAFGQKGLFQMGSIATPVYFEDTNKSINIEDTLYVNAVFNEYKILNVNSVCRWIGITINKLGIVGKGNFNNPDSATVLHDSCTFNDLGDFNYDGSINANTVPKTTYTRCGTITTNGAILTSCKFLNSYALISVSTNNLSEIIEGIFESDGNNHAVELKSIGGGSMIWDGITSGYDAGVSGSPVTPTTTGNEDIFVNVASGTLTINIASGATIPSVRSAGAIVNIVAGLISLSISGHPVGATVIVYDLDSADPQELGTRLATFDNAVSVVNYSYSGGKAGDSVQIKMIEPNYKTYTEPHTLGASDASYPIKAELETN